MVRLLHAIIGEDGRLIEEGRRIRLPAAREEMLVARGFAKKIAAMENPDFSGAIASMTAAGEDDASQNGEGMAAGKDRASGPAGGGKGTAENGTEAAGSDEGADKAAAAGKDAAANGAKAAGNGEGANGQSAEALFGMEAGEKPLGRKAK